MLISFVIALMLLFKTSAAIDCGITQKTTYGELRRQLLCAYDRTMRPVLDINKAIIITLRMHLKSYDYEENGNRLTLYSWFSMSWIDEHLTWDKTRFDNINEILVSSHEIWTPDISLYNSDNGQNIAAHNDVNAEVDFTGKLMCVLPIEHTAHCRPNYKRWPYDSQNCTLYFGSWMSPGEHIDYNNKSLGVVVKDTQPNPHWKIISAKAKRSAKQYACCPNQTFPTIEFEFNMERHSGSYEVIFLIPALIMIIMNLLIFLMSHEENRRLILCALNVLSHFLFAQHLTWLVPNNGDTTPDVMIFYRDSMFITLVVLVETVVVQGLDSCQYLVPNWVDRSVKMVSANAVANMVFFRMPYERKIDEETADSAILVQAKQEITIWKLFGKFLDRLCFLIFFIAYAIMFVALLPETY